MSEIKINYKECRKRPDQTQIPEEESFMVWCKTNDGILLRCSELLFDWPDFIEYEGIEWEFSHQEAGSGKSGNLAEYFPVVMKK